MFFLASGPGREKSPVAGRVALSGCQKTQASRLSLYRKITDRSQSYQENEPSFWLTEVAEVGHKFP
jgi:hypothetical protein